MQPPICKATFILRLWADSEMLEDNVWHGTAEHLGSAQLSQFQTLDEFIEWLRQELGKIEITQIKDK